MSKSNIAKVIGEILSDEKNLVEFFSCENQDELYNYCMSKGTGYTREEFDDFIEETISKANIVSENEEINQNSLSDGGAKASFGKKIRQAFTKVLATGLAVFSVAPVVQNLMPNTAQANNTIESINEEVDKEKVLNKGFKSKIKNLSTAKKVGLGVGALGTIAAIGVGAYKLIPEIFVKKNDSGVTGGPVGGQNQQEQLTNKIVLLGDTDSGKTALVERMTNNVFYEEFCSTVLVNYQSKSYKIEKQKIKHDFWDTEGSERYRGSIQMYFPRARLFIFAISLKKEDFEKQIGSIRKFFEKFKESAPENAKGIVVMTKADLNDKMSIDDAKQQINLAIQDFDNGSIKDRVKLFDKPISSKNNENVDELENAIIEGAV